MKTRYGYPGRSYVRFERIKGREKAKAKVVGKSYKNSILVSYDLMIIKIENGREILSEVIYGVTPDRVSVCRGCN